MTRVPSTPAFIRGVINLRGSVVPVVDLACKFRLPESAVTKRTCIIIVEIESEGAKIVMGVLADAVNQVVEFAPDEIEAPPSFGTPHPRRLPAGPRQARRRVRADPRHGPGPLLGRARRGRRRSRGGRVVTVAARRAAHAPARGGRAHPRDLGARVRALPDAHPARRGNLPRARQEGAARGPALEAAAGARPDDLRRVLHAHRGRGRPRRAHPDARLHQHERDALLPRAAAVRVPRAPRDPRLEGARRPAGSCASGAPGARRARSRTRSR